MSETLPGRLSDLFGRLSGMLFSEETVQSALDLTVSLAQEVLTDTAGAGVTLIREGKKLTAAFTDRVVQVADNLQYELDEGPCLSAWREGVPFKIDTMTEEDRWPRWAPAAAGMGMGSALSVPLLVRGSIRIGAVKVYSTQPGAYDDHDLKVLSMFADQASIVLSNVQSYEEARQLGDEVKRAMRTRQVTTLAMGMLMEREGMDESGAFTWLRKHSQASNAPVQRIANDLVAEAAQRRSKA